MSNYIWVISLQVNKILNFFYMFHWLQICFKWFFINILCSNRMVMKINNFFLQKLMEQFKIYVVNVLTVSDLFQGSHFTMKNLSFWKKSWNTLEKMFIKKKFCILFRVLVIIEHIKSCIKVFYIYLMLLWKHFKK